MHYQLDQPVPVSISHHFQKPETSVLWNPQSVSESSKELHIPHNLALLILPKKFREDMQLCPAIAS